MVPTVSSKLSWVTCSLSKIRSFRLAPRLFASAIVLAHLYFSYDLKAEVPAFLGFDCTKLMHWESSRSAMAWGERAAQPWFEMQFVQQSCSSKLFLSGWNQCRGISTSSLGAEICILCCSNPFAPATLSETLHPTKRRSQNPSSELPPEPCGSGSWGNKCETRKPKQNRALEKRIWGHVGPKPATYIHLRSYLMLTPPRYSVLEVNMHWPSWGVASIEPSASWWIGCSRNAP